MNKHDDFTQFNPDKTEKLLWSYSGNYRRNCQVYFPFCAHVGALEVIYESTFI